MIPESLQSAELILGDDLASSGRTAKALAVYQEAFDRDDLPEYHFAKSVLVKRIVDLLLLSRGPAGAMAYYGLQRLDDRECVIGPDDILCVTVVREEGPQLPFFLEYYERLGVDRFLFIDNGSTDDTCELLLQHPKVHLWRSETPYWEANFGTAWAEVVLRSLSVNSWCLTVDADEFLHYPEVETTGLHELCASLDQAGKKALSAVLLDMYSDGPIREAVCARGQNPFDVCAYFDRQTVGQLILDATPWKNYTAYTGGVRRRVFGPSTEPFLGKIPLVRYSDELIICVGWHGVSVLPEEMAAETGALLHASFTAKFVTELERQIRWRSQWGHQGQSYREFAKVIAEHPSLSCFDLERSEKLRDSQQLIELGFMRSKQSAGSSMVVHVENRTDDQAPCIAEPSQVSDALNRLSNELGILQRRLSLIEGSRTWRLRLKVMDLIARLKRSAPHQLKRAAEGIMIRFQQRR